MEKRKAAARPVNRSNKKKKSSHVGRIVLGIVTVLFVMLIGIGCGFLTASMNTRANIAEDILPSASSHIYDINGNEIANVHATENREPVKLSQVPINLQNAFIAVEDNRFYEHSGVDPRGILRAVFKNVMGGEVAEGGSTITQQLAKNAYLTQERTLKRKIQEVFLALQLERQYTKQEILEFYLNQIYFGQGAYGVQAAAQTYYGKNVEDLDLNECAMLAGLPKSPNYYSPASNLDAAQERKGVVLDQMVKYDYITSGEASKVRNVAPTIIQKSANEAKVGAYFLDYVTQQLIERYGADAVYKEGLKVYTTIDMDMQQAAEAAVASLDAQRTDANGVMQPQVALVSIDPHTGYILAMVGGRGTDQFNRATLAERQPGSSFKPFVFAAALQEGFTPDTIIDDSPIKVGGWSPHNYNGNYNGKVPLRYVAEQSLNVPTVKIAQKIGMDKPLFYAQEMGITTLVLDGAHNDRNLASSLGGLTRGITPLEMVSAYGTFANKGVHVEPVSIVRVVDRNGKTLEEHQTKSKTVLSESSTAALNSMLQGVVLHGTGARANIGRPVAGKTGTTDNWRDAWFVGYTPDLVAGVWVGNDDNTSLGVMTGGMEPAQIWKAFMQKVLEGIPAKSFPGAPPPAAKVTYIGDEGKEGDDGGKSSDRKTNTKNTSKSKSDQKSEVPTPNGNGSRSGNTGNRNIDFDRTSDDGTQNESAPAPSPGANVEKGRN
ncbi:hypothetical protein TAMA11512_11930 [Selenomonas sp. TAMA-11512]|uniref:transglycosylase domain-containing protein n=1 Tax=Selenomonas sp. TAMA-11512 TaxID=3095337 RepID=UPI003088E150|nr:hypothetical protein TAMA11512_11930 [Selenomonas sp. TAMA-11512]